MYAMLLPHERIAAQAYWEGPTVSYEKNPSALVTIGNLAVGDGLVSIIDDVYATSLDRGCESMPIEPGRDLPLPLHNQVLKIVQDTRSTLRKPENPDPDEHLQTFDLDALEMLEKSWFTDFAVRATVETPEGVFSIGRSVYYTTRPAFGDWPLGKNSIALGRRHLAPTQLQPRPVGQIATQRTRKGTMEVKYSAAELITPAPRKRSTQKSWKSLKLPTLSFDDGANPALGTA